MNRARDINAKKDEETKEDDYELDASQQAAELQVGAEEERANPDRFEPDPKAEPPAKIDSIKKRR